MRIITKTFMAQGELVKIHAISTGMVAVKERFRETDWRGLPAILSSFLDPRFTEWMPIWTWVIEHPEGIFLIDTGENSQVNNPAYFKSSGHFENWMNRTQFKFKVDREEEVDAQLMQIGIQPEDISTVVLTHLHLDHIDGLKYFPTNKILVNQLEWQKPYGDLPKLYPPWFKPTLIEMNEEFPVFGKSAFLTQRRDIVLLSTPGHTYGHSSVLLMTDQCHLLFAGDVVYYERQLTENRYSAANVSPRDAQETYRKIKAYSQLYKLIVLPSHDHEAGLRLEQEIIFGRN